MTSPERAKEKREILFVSIMVFFIIIVAAFSLTPIALLLKMGLASLKTALKNEEMISAIFLSFKTSFWSTIICTIFSLPASYGLSRYEFPMKRLLLLFIYLPMSLPHLASGIALLLFFSKTAMGELLSGIGLDFIFTVKGIIAAQVFVNMPYMIKILKNAFDEMDIKMEFVARTLGCSEFMTLYHVTLPTCKKNLISALVITWSRSLGEFGAVLMLAGATRFKTETLPMAIFLNMSTGDLDLAVAAASILIIMSMVSHVIFEQLDRDTIQ
ncbi:molybdate transport system permease protein [Dethiosulfatibacter aminovorans DSM 17477]|uniref:Molybdate transport system permease protein n=1 Tax=Dethiosulfatibacter aminovorans DSM 17477 TaxID=1121476 RepID=A0A1M6ABX8_9FIRM|nr:ABC transporter permease [Dethiosulfatibacter aminovorans]SHI33931.1 molybdate transport system permease protein [Dethiosulfatibacter aminovorans DSM 17477]